MSNSFYAVILMFLFHTIGQVEAYDGNIIVAGNNVIGGNVIITCSWNLQINEVFFDVTIRPPNTSDSNYYFIINRGITLDGPLRNASKHALDRSSFNNQSVSMSISGLQCADDQDYGCFFRFSIGGSSSAALTRTFHLDVKAPPRQATQTATTTAPVSHAADEHAKTFLGNVTITGDNVVGGSVTIKCSWTLLQNDTLFDLTIRPANSPVFYFIANTCGLVVHGDLYDASRHTIEHSSFGARSVSMNISGLQSLDEHDYSCFFRVVNSHRFKFYDTISHLHVKGI